jgi:hypothetical protein
VKVLHYEVLQPRCSLGPIAIIKLNADVVDEIEALIHDTSCYFSGLYFLSCMYGKELNENLFPYSLWVGPTNPIHQLNLTHKQRPPYTVVIWATCAVRLTHQ